MSNTFAVKGEHDKQFFFRPFDVGYTLLFLHNILVSFSTLKIAGIIQAFMLLVSFSMALMCFFLKNRFSLKVTLATIALVCLAIVSYRYSGKMDMLYFTFMLFFLQCCDITTFLQIDMRNRIAVVLLLFILSSVGIIENTAFQKNALLFDAGMGYGYGFNNPNNLGFMLFLAFIDYLLLSNRKNSSIQLKVFLAIITVALFISFTTGSRTALLMTFVAYFAYQGRNGKLKKMASNPWIMIPVICLIPLGTYAFAASYNSGNPIHSFINMVTTGRVSLLKSFIAKYPLEIMGSVVEYGRTQVGRGATVCDNVFVYLLHNLGIVPFVLWLGIALVTCIQLIKKDLTFETMAFIVLLLYGIVENTMANVMFFPLIVYCSKGVFMWEYGGIRYE